MWNRNILGLVVLTALIGLPSPACAELTPLADVGFFRLVPEDPATEALVRLEVLQGTGPAPGSGFVLQITLYRDDGRFTVFVGTIERGGLNIPFVNLYEVEAPLEFLRDLEGSLASSETFCQIPFLDLQAEMTFECQDRSGNRQGASGRLIPHRAPAAPVLRSMQP